MVRTLRCFVFSPFGNGKDKAGGGVCSGWLVGRNALVVLRSSFGKFEKRSDRRHPVYPDFWWCEPGRKSENVAPFFLDLVSTVSTWIVYQWTVRLHHCFLLGVYMHACVRATTPPIHHCRPITGRKNASLWYLTEFKRCWVFMHIFGHVYFIFSVFYPMNRAKRKRVNERKSTLKNFTHCSEK